MSEYFNKDLFGKRLLESMKDNNDTTYSLAEYLHLSPSAISRYTTGDMAPKIPTVHSIADKYGIRGGWLMGIEGVSKYPEAKETAKSIPVLGVIAAGLPILAQENIEGYEYVPSDMDVDFCLRVQGDSMIGAYIFDGALVFIRQQQDVEAGEIAAVLIDDEVTLKRFYKNNGGVILKPENAKYQPIYYSEDSFNDIRILGKAIFFQSEV